MSKFFVPLLLLCFVSCQSTENEIEFVESIQQNTAYIASHNATSTLSIEGMTCEIGCVRTVKSHLSKMNGILTVDMNFDTARTIDYSTVEFDTNLISETEMQAEIESIANGIYNIINVNTH